ncbi:hypothetical protein [Actinomadura sp. 7K507]|uniref:hypothetical protein n=1 Tax=Actinomadura sp. 7K507 TaxID=2530365 RepID=UPI00104E2B33|nr:hypothetical protein [Actinomadura sp. 7K507]TDC89573.1 hypothetical protein E1285_16185 [Actinomadura sp. 7K507]
MKTTKFTLDTNCVIYGVTGTHYKAELDRLVALAKAGDIELWLTAGFQDDQDRASAAYVAANQAWLEKRPILGLTTGPFRFDYSMLDGRDGFVSDATAAADEAIKGIVFPSHAQMPDASNDKQGTRWRQRMTDVQHLTSHFAHGHDVFVTSDRDILDRKARLYAEAGITVADLPKRYRSPRARRNCTPGGSHAAIC